MNFWFKLINLSVLILGTVLSENVCNTRCTCSKTVVHCDSKGWENLNDKEFPSNVVTLSLVSNHLRFNSIEDRAKIENLDRLSHLILSGNPLGIIPPFNNSKITSLSLQDTSLTSAEIPSTYAGSLLHKISLSNNEIRSIKENDFISLKNSKLNTLHMNSVSLSTIDQNAFASLMELQSLSLKNNLLKSCEFLSTFRLLSSIELDANQFTSLPQQLAAPKNIKKFSFTNNSIAVIDESSPLHAWIKINATDLTVNLTNNPFDCCQSLWFIRFLKTTPRFVPDASLLKCAQPTAYAGRFLMKLDPDQMNCSGIPPSRPWWTTGRIIAVSIGGLITMLILITGVFVLIRQRKSRSGYAEIDGIDDPSLSAPLLFSSEPSLPTAPPPTSPSEFRFPPYGEDDDAFSTRSTAITRNTSASQAPTITTAVGASARN